MGALMKSIIVKRSIVIGGHKTSVSLEDAFWTNLKNIAQNKQETLGELVGRIDQTRGQGNIYPQRSGCMCSSTFATGTNENWSDLADLNCVSMSEVRSK